MSLMILFGHPAFAVAQMILGATAAAGLVVGLVTFDWLNTAIGVSSGGVFAGLFLWERYRIKRRDQEMSDHVMQGARDQMADMRASHLLEMKAKTDEMAGAYVRYQQEIASYRQQIADLHAENSALSRQLHRREERRDRGKPQP